MQAGGRAVAGRTRGQEEVGREQGLHLVQPQEQDGPVPLQFTLPPLPGCWT